MHHKFHVALEFDRESKKYVSGEYIRGTVVLTLEHGHAQHVENIKVFFHGHVKVHVKHTAHELEKLKTRLSYTTYTIPVDRDLEVGIHRFPFELFTEAHLPSDIFPKKFKKIDYAVGVELDHAIAHAFQEVPVHLYGPNNYATAMEEAEQKPPMTAKYVRKVPPEDSILAEVTCRRSLVVIGEPIELDIHVKNDTKYEIKKVKASLRAIFGGEQHFDQSSVEEKRKIEKRSEDTFSMTFTPEFSAPPFGNPLIRWRYVIRVHMVLNSILVEPHFGVHVPVEVMVWNPDTVLGDDGPLDPNNFKPSDDKETYQGVHETDIHWDEEQTNVVIHDVEHTTHRKYSIAE